MTIKKYNRYGKELEQLLILKDHPIAVKMLKREADIPEGAFRPKRDAGYHLAQCQAFALSRRQGKVVAMLKEDHWCFAPLMAYGLVEDPHDEFISNAVDFPCFSLGRYIGMVSASLESAPFEPDLVLIYAEPAQIRRLLMAVKHGEKRNVFSEFDAIDSCAYAIVPVIEKNEYRITIPDPGEYSRTAVRDDELIFSIPKDRLPGLIDSLK
ncbi:MAG: DUF169 domain-containing protein, partial [Deltaproteobacteria bacterium]|nr:DUF169 domain-containing protein [Deltaproteobacteria bacterium]